MTQTNFLIGRGELLTQPIKAPPRNIDKAEVYTLQQAVERLVPQFRHTADALQSLPDGACPGGLAVARMVMNPSYIARSYYPRALLQEAGLTTLGSRSTRVTPEQWKRKKVPEEASTTEFFVAGKRKTFSGLAQLAKAMPTLTAEAIDLARIEQFLPFGVEERIVSLGGKNNRYFEVAVHLMPDADQDFIQNAFLEYAKTLEVTVHDKLGFVTGNLWFVAVQGSHASVTTLATFAFVRVVRPLAKLRTFRPIARVGSPAASCRIPTGMPVSLDARVAILDGGLPAAHGLGPWLGKYIEMDEFAHDHPDGPGHGLAVTSAFLFGPIEPHGTAPRPYSYANHLRVLDNDSEDEDPLELFRTLGLIEQALLARDYEFVNLSLGPNLPITDNDVHAWTSVIDDLLSDGRTLMTVAVGNNGELDRLSGNARVQVPSDCVNALAVGASDKQDDDWKRAPYSAIGPGRHPGLVKPDLMAFGGSAPRYFHTLAEGKTPRVAPLFGTSFSAPCLLRTAVGIRAILGTDLKPLAIKALLIHAARTAGHDMTEVGWGAIPEDIADIITCAPGVARIVYQGELKPGKYLRATMPLPAGGLTGKVKVRATFCYASPTDPQDASAYTRAGLDVAFRPNDKKVKDGAAGANTKSFFTRAKYATEGELRADHGKWETVLHSETTMFGKSLENPVFDIHYNAREGGHQATGAKTIPYALIITIEAPKHADIFNEILRTYANKLVALQSEVAIPVRVGS